MTSPLMPDSNPAKADPTPVELAERILAAYEGVDTELTRLLNPSPTHWSDVSKVYAPVVAQALIEAAARIASLEALTLELGLTIVAMEVDKPED